MIAKIQLDLKYYKFNEYINLLDFIIVLIIEGIIELFLILFSLFLFFFIIFLL